MIDEKNCKETPETCACACGLSVEEIDAVQDRLLELEDINRELLTIGPASSRVMDVQKQNLLMNGEHFEYQQGQIDAWETVRKTLEGLTNFHELTQTIRKQVETFKKGEPDISVG